MTEKSRVPQELSGARKSTMVFLVLLCALVYNSNGQLIASGDTRPASLIPFSILLDGTTSLDRFFATDVGGADGLLQMSPAERSRYYYLTVRDGHLHSMYPVTTPLLVTPLYAPVVWLKGDWSTEEVLRIAPIAEKLAASLIVSLSVAAMYFLLVALTTNGRALLLSLAFAFATTTWTTSSQALWQHGSGVLFIILTLAALARRPNSPWIAGLCAGLAVACRPTNLFLLLGVIVVVAYTRRSIRSGFVVTLTAALVGLPLALYNTITFGDVRGGYSIVHDAFRGFLPEGLAGILVSPSRGLFIYSPFLIAGIVGIYLVARNAALRRSPVYLTAALFLASQLVFFGWWVMWWGGWSYGPRLLTEAAAVLVVLSVPALDRMHLRPWTAPVFTLLLLYSAGVQAVGALAYTYDGWNAKPVSVDVDRRRLWDWRDSQISRTGERLVTGEWFSGCRSMTDWLTLRCFSRRYGEG